MCADGGKERKNLAQESQATLECEQQLNAFYYWTSWQVNLRAGKAVALLDQSPVPAGWVLQVKCFRDWEEGAMERMERPCHEALTRGYCFRKDRAFQPKLEPTASEPRSFSGSPETWVRLILTLELLSCEETGMCWGNPMYTKSQAQAFPGEGSWPTELEEFLPSSMSAALLLPGTLAASMLF